MNKSTSIKRYLRRKWLLTLFYLDIFRNFNKYILGRSKIKLDTKLQNHYSIAYARGSVIAIFVCIFTINFHLNKTKDPYQILTEDKSLDYIKSSLEDVATIDNNLQKNSEVFLKLPKTKPDEFGDKQILGFGNNIDARTIISLFEEEDYNLKDIRKGKAVEPIFLSKLPTGIENLDNINDRKRLFIRVVLPLVLYENEQILDDREILNQISREKKLDTVEKDWLTKKFKEYKVSNNNIEELKVKMDIIPVSIALAQAAYESGWGTSRFAMEGNSLYGARTWKKGKGLVPNERDEDEKFEVAAFKIIRASISSYKKNLNTHSSYKEFREKRAKQRKALNRVNGLELAKYLYNYSEIGFTYVERLQKIIEQNSLTDFDDAILSKKKKPNIV